MVTIIEVILNLKNWNLSFTLNWGILLAVVVLLIIVKFIIRFVRSNNKQDIIPVELSYTIGGASVKYAIIRNHENVEIAHKIYVELITRKAAIEIDETNDVITEVYNSWYNLFQITRDELKQLSGHLLINNQTSGDLITLLTDILNKGLRPHLTEHQARFRKWYQEALEKEGNKGKSPQEIQREYDNYNQLVKSMKQVNKLLINYANQLQLILKGK